MVKRMSCLLILLLGVSIGAQDYDALLDKLIKFYGYQRSGLKSGPSGNLNNQDIHKGDAYNGHPLDGGWNDAGDYIKFGMPLSYTVYCLLKGYDLFPSIYNDKYNDLHANGADGVPDILNQVKYATDYICKAVIDENTVVLDVGYAQDEHEIMGVKYTEGRTQNSQIFLCDGGDIPAVYAADLALMSVLYRKFSPAYATQCSTKAIVAFNFAKKKIEAKKYYSTPQLKAGKPLYDYYDANDGQGKWVRIEDKMVAAGIELFRATNDGDPIYRTWTKKMITQYFNCLTYSFVGPLAAIEVWRQGLGDATSTGDNAGFIGTKIKTSGFFTGVYQNAGWGTARDVGTAAFVNALAYIVTSAQVQRDSLLNRTKNHVNWVNGTFGQTRRSYIVGGGAATNIHYRPTSAGPTGGVVSGPDGDGRWENNGDAKYCEVAIDYNAGIVGAVGFLKALNSTSTTDVKMSSAFSATPMNDVDFTSQSVSFKATFSQSVNCTLKIIGAFGSKTIIKSGTALNETWDGKADKGFFLSGESVPAQIKIDKPIVVWDIIKAKALAVSIARATKIPTSASDVLIDNFDDGDTLNKLKGSWMGFSSDELSFGGRTIIGFDTMNGSKAIKATCKVTSDGPSTYAGIKATFDSAGRPTPIGNANSVFFDLKANKETYLRVELVQPSITDNAYYGIKIPVTTLANTYRVNIADFSQPDWKTVEKPLDRNTISMLRFTVYDSTSTIILNLDNVYMENLNTSIRVDIPKKAPSSFLPVVTNNTLRYRMPSYAILPRELTIYDVAGRIVMKRTIQAGPGEIFSVSFSHLPAGFYSITHSVNGKSTGEKFRIMHVR